MLKNILIFFLISTSLYAVSLKELLNSIEVTNENYQAQQALQQMAKKQYESASKDNFPTLNLIGAYENNSKVLEHEPEDILYGELKASYTLYDIETLKIDLENSILQLSLLTGLDILPQDNDKLLEPIYKEEQRYDIEAKKLEAQSSKYSSEKYNYLPTISINNSLKKQEYLHYDEIYNDKLNNQISLQINIPIFDFGKISKDKEASQLETLALNKEIEYKEKSIQIERKLALKSLESSKIKLDSAIAALEATNTTYEFSKKRFDANLISYTEYLTELTKKQDANYRIILAKNDIELKKANLAFALGIDLLTLIKE